jgi:transcriptional regulator with XRE-family HTH domain
MVMSSHGSAGGRCGGQADAVLLGALVRDLRLANGWSQGRLVAALELVSGVPLAREYVSRWENGKRKPGRFWLGHLATVLQVPLTVLEEGERVDRRAFLTDLAAGVPDRPGGGRDRAGRGIGPDRARVQRGAGGAPVC